MSEFRISPLRDMPWDAEELRSLLADADDVHLRISRMHRIIQVSPSVQGLLGYSPKDILGLKIDELCHDADGWRSFLKALGESGGALQNYVIRLRRMKGTVLWASVNASGLYEGESAEIGLTVRKITYRLEEMLAIRTSRDRLRDLFAYEQKVRDEEKARLARELHDGLGGVLTLLTIELSRFADSLPAEFQPPSRDLMLLVDQAIAITRNVVTDLHPPILDDLGLYAALAWQAEEWQRHTGIVCRLDCRGECPPVDGERALALFRLVQEALNNVVRHAQAGEVAIVCHEEAGHLSLSIRDNGVGLARDAIHKPGSYGIRGMFERMGRWCGSLRVDSEPGKGTTLWVRLPLTDRENVS